MSSKGIHFSKTNTRVKKINTLECKRSRYNKDTTRYIYICRLNNYGQLGYKVEIDMIVEIPNNDNRIFNLYIVYWIVMGDLDSFSQLKTDINEVNFIL